MKMHCVFVAVGCILNAYIAGIAITVMIIMMRERSQNANTFSFKPEAQQALHNEIHCRQFTVEDRTGSVVDDDDGDDDDNGNDDDDADDNGDDDTCNRKKKKLNTKRKIEREKSGRIYCGDGDECVSVCISSCFRA